MNRSPAMRAPLFSVTRFDEAVFAAQRHVDDLAFDALDAARLGIAPQVVRVEAGVEVIGVGDAARAANSPARRCAET